MTGAEPINRVVGCLCHKNVPENMYDVSAFDVVMDKLVTGAEPLLDAYHKKRIRLLCRPEASVKFSHQSRYFFNSNTNQTPGQAWR